MSLGKPKILNQFEKTIIIRPCIAMAIKITLDVLTN